MEVWAMKNYFQKLNDVIVRVALFELGVDITEDDKVRERFVLLESGMTKVPRAEPGAFQKVKSSAKGNGGQRILHDYCEFGENEQCYGEA
jgi:hypothetical protein